MKIKVFRSIANSLCQMCCSAHINRSLEYLADLPDGTVEINLLSESCKHSVAGDLSLPMVADFNLWLSKRLEQVGLSVDVMQSVQVSLRYNTDRVPTDRNRILLFELECSSKFVVAKRIINGYAENVHWYERQTG